MSTVLGRIPIDLDWETKQLGSFAFEWRASRADRASLVVKLLENAGSYAVEMFTDSQAGVRARAKDQWRKGLSRTDALTHLDAVFSEA